MKNNFLKILNNEKLSHEERKFAERMEEALSNKYKKEEIELIYFSYKGYIDNLNSSLITKISINPILHSEMDKIYYSLNLFF
jgi:hypothetical protein